MAVLAKVDETIGQLLLLTDKDDMKFLPTIPLNVDNIIGSVIKTPNRVDQNNETGTETRSTSNDHQNFLAGNPSYILYLWESISGPDRTEDVMQVVAHVENWIHESTMKNVEKWLEYHMYVLHTSRLTFLRQKTLDTNNAQRFCFYCLLYSHLSSNHITHYDISPRPHVQAWTILCYNYNKYRSFGN